MIQGCKPHCLFIVSNIWISIWFCPNRLGSFLWKRQIELKCLVVLFESLQKYGLKLEAKREPDMQPTITEEVQPEIPASQIVDPAPQPSDQDTTVVVTKDEFEQNQKGRVPLTDHQGIGAYQCQFGSGTQGLCSSIDQTYTKSKSCGPAASQPYHINTKVARPPSCQIVQSPHSAVEFSSTEVNSSHQIQVGFY